MEQAVYGRMAVGRCIPINYEIGCHMDVLGFMDSLCSGRQTCHLRLPDEDLGKYQPCQRGLESYLQLNYRCIAGTQQIAPTSFHHIKYEQKKKVYNCL